MIHDDVVTNARMHGHGNAMAVGRGQRRVLLIWMFNGKRAGRDVVGFDRREEIRFGSASWSVCVVAGCAHTDYRIMDGAFIIYLSVNDREELADPEAEGIYFEPTDQSPVRLSIEKDYPCEHPRGADAKEPQTETFAAPCADAEEAIAGEIDTPPAAC